MQELTDWRGANHQKGKLTKVEKPAVLKRMQAIAIANSQDKFTAMRRQKKLANKEDAMAEDFAFQNTAAFGGLLAFRRESPALCLQRGEKRFFVEAADLPDDVQAISYDRKRRACIRKLQARRG